MADVIRLDEFIKNCTIDADFNSLLIQNLKKGAPVATFGTGPFMASVILHNRY